jgi:hypothetical protein
MTKTKRAKKPAVGATMTLLLGVSAGALLVPPFASMLGGASSLIVGVAKVMSVWLL